MSTDNNTKSFSPGDRVTSTIAGYYMGIPGKIIGPNQAQYGYGRIYTIELVIGKRIALREQHIERLERNQENVD